MDSSLVSLDAYIDSLRDYYLLRRGELMLSAINFEELFDNIRQFYSMYTQNKDVAFEISVDQKEIFSGDKALLELILHNLLSNAFKYQRKGQENQYVKLSVFVSERKAKIIVSDNGIGISPEYVEDIFKLFFRASDQAKGMGFGLYNVQNALLKLQGKIEVQSQPNQGTTFTVIIPSK
jgi:signal transduction histidine kinase